MPSPPRKLILLHSWAWDCSFHELVSKAAVSKHYTFGTCRPEAPDSQFQLSQKCIPRGSQQAAERLAAST